MDKCPYINQLIGATELYNRKHHFDSTPVFIHKIYLL